MKVKVARTAGFCGGVRGAVNIALDAARRGPGPIATLGPLVHNPHVVAMLESLGLNAVKAVPEGGAVVIRAHGAAPAVRAELEARGLMVVDATCPKVAGVHQVAARRHAKGYMIVVLGDRGHPEVEGIVGYADGGACVVETADEVADLPKADKICLVAQTTQERERFEAVAEALKRRFPDAELMVVNTICNATRERQDEVRRLAAEVEAVVVVGGPDSANTRRLVEVAHEAGRPAFLVDNENDLDREQLAKYRVVGLTAGASTPNWMIRRIYDALLPIGRKPTLKNRALTLGNWLVLANLYIALGAAALTLTAARLMGHDPYLREYLINFLFVFAAHTITLLGNSRALALNVPARARAFTRYRSHFVAASLAAAGLSIALGFSLGTWTGGLLSALAAVSVLYPVRLVRASSGEQAPIRSLAEVPASKDIFMAVGWGVLIVAIPLAAHRPTWNNLPAVAAAMVLVTGLVFVRALLRDFRDIQADRLIGRETLPMVLGAERTRRMLYAGIMAVAAALAAATALGLAPAPLGYLILIPLAYAAACVPLFTRQAVVQGFGAESIIDAVFIIAGITALAA